MPEIIFPTRRCPVEELIELEPHEVAGFCTVNGLLPGAAVQAYTPYALPDHPAALAVATQLRALSPTERERLACCAEQFGDLTVALAAFYDKHLAFVDLQNTAGLVGAGATAKVAHLDVFQASLRRYQAALIELHAFERSGRGSGAQRAQLQQMARQRFDALNKQFRVELDRLVPAADLGKNRGGPLTSSARGIRLASRARARRLYVADQGKAVQIAGLARAINHVGNSMIVLDAGIRAHGIYRTYQSGGNWQREAAVEATGFGIGGAIGIGVGQLTVAALTMGLVATPVGWVAIVVIGAAAGFGAAYIGNEVGKRAAGMIWDRGR